MSEILQYLPIVSLVISLVISFVIPYIIMPNFKAGISESTKPLIDAMTRLTTSLNKVESDLRLGDIKREVIESKVNDHESRIRVLEKE